MSDNLVVTPEMLIRGGFGTSQNIYALESNAGTSKFAHAIAPALRVLLPTPL
jgi:hypothetical protein